MPVFHFVVLILSLVFLPNIYNRMECLDRISLRRFYKIRSCHRSNTTIIGAGNFENITQCIKFARERNGLALNFSPSPRNPRSHLYSRLNGYSFNCQILECPEVGNMTTLVKDTNYDYYSLYGILNGTKNATCLRNVGVFNLHKDKQNYTNAIISCQQEGGDLADIVTEARTNGLSNLVGTGVDEWYKAAYVGLDDIRREGRFETPLGSPLQCFQFRAWSPSHPRSQDKHDDCVIIDNEKTWKVINCKHKLSYICELYPQEVKNEEEKPNCTRVTDKKKRRECAEKMRRYEILQKAPREEMCELVQTWYYNTGPKNASEEV